MRASVLQENLAKGLAVVNRAIGSRPSMPILNNVLMSANEAQLKLSATNLELGITVRIGAKVDEEGAITVPARTLLDLVNMLPAERVDLELDTRTSNLNIRCNAKTANIKGVDPNEFPIVPEAEAETGIAVPAQTLREMIDQVVFAAAKEDNRPILTGILTKIDGTTMIMAAADGYRLSVRTAELDTPVETPLSLIIPARTLSELSKIITEADTVVYISIPSGRSQVMFHLENVDVVSQLIDGNFPPYEQIIPKTRSTLTQVYTTDFLRACKFSEIFARDVSNTSRIRIVPGENNLTPGQIHVMAQSQEKGDGENVLQASVEGPGLEVSFNVRYLIDALNVISEEQIAIETNGPSSPGVIKPVGRKDFTYVVMPMSVTRS